MQNKQTKIFVIVVGLAFLSFVGWALSDGDMKDDSIEKIFDDKKSNEEVKSTNNSLVEDRVEIEKENWSYSEDYDKLRDKTTYWATTSSLETFDFGFPYNSVQQNIVLRNRPLDGFNIMLTLTKGQYNCGFDGCYINVKFDAGSIQKYSVVSGSGGSTDVLFIEGKSKFLKALRKSSSVMIEAQYYNHGPETFTFNVSKLKWK